jgi:hypothetical protein
VTALLGSSSEVLAARLDEAHRLVREEGADATMLYRTWFHQETGRLLDWPQAGAYLAAVTRPEAFQDGWTVIDRGAGAAGAVVAERAGRRRVVAPPQLLPADPRALHVTPGTRVRVHPLVGAESGGFWHLWSVGWQRRAPRRYRRIYLHVEPPGALEVVTRIAAAAPADPGWAMKALCGSHTGGRRDGALLYLPWPTSLDTGWVAAVLRAVQPWCRPGLPPFVAPIAPGVGWAPDPGDGRSFGEAVCQAVADAAEQHREPAPFAAAARQAVAELGEEAR